MEIQDSDTALIVLLSVFAGMFLIMLVLAVLVLTGPVSHIAMVNGFGTLLLALITLVLAIPALIAWPAIDSRGILRLWPFTPRGSQHVLVVEGIARKRVRDADYLPVYTIEVGGRQFAVQKATYSTIDTSLRYRVYYLPRGCRLLSMEPLAAQSAQETVYSEPGVCCRNYCRRCERGLCGSRAGEYHCRFCRDFVFCIGRRWWKAGRDLSFCCRAVIG